VKKTILVTGGAGFIGSNFVNYIYNKYPEWKILILDALTYAGSIENLPPEVKNNTRERIEFHYGNVTNAQLVNMLVERSDLIVHFAAETHVSRSIYDNRIFFETDVLGTQTLANAVQKNTDRIEKFIHISTSEVYGTAVSEYMDEHHILNPMSPYAAAKAGADRLVYSYHTTYNLPVTIVRPFNNYGARQHLEKVIPRFITSAILGENLHVHGDGSAARDFVHVDDTCRALDAILHAPMDLVVGKIFNVGSGQHRTVLSIAKDILQIISKKVVSRGEIQFIGNRPGQVDRHTCDWFNINHVLGWTPEMSWENGLESTVDWYINNVEFWKKQLWMREIPIVTAAGVVEMH